LDLIDYLEMILKGLLLFLVVIGVCDGATSYKAERITAAGPVEYISSEPFVTAVGCVEQLKVTFYPINGVLPATINLYRLGTDFQITASAALIGPGREHDIICCSHYPLDRNAVLKQLPGYASSTCQGGEYNLNYFDFFQCSLLQVETVNNTKVATIYFVPPAGSDITSNGFGNITFSVQPITGEGIKTERLIVNIQIRQCNACIKAGEGLNAFAKRFYTHWLQVYSSNPEINRNPNQIDENQVIRLGPLYSVRIGDTLMSIATKFGVTVNQVLCMVKVDCMPADRQC